MPTRCAQEAPAGANYFIESLGEKLTTFLNSSKLGLATAVRLFEMFKDGKISEEETTFVKKCLDELVFEIIDGDLVNLNAYMEVMKSVFNLLNENQLTSLKGRSFDAKYLH